MAQKGHGLSFRIPFSLPALGGQTFEGIPELVDVVIIQADLVIAKVGDDDELD